MSVEAPIIRKIFAMLEAWLTSRDYFAAKRFTFADALLSTTLNPTFRFPEAAEVLAKSPAVRRYFELHSRRRSFVDTAAAS